MREIDLAGPGRPVRLSGIVDAQRTPKGLRLSRLPAAAQAESLDPALPWAASIPAGARLELVTDSTRLELAVQLLRLSSGDRPLTPATFDLVVDGAVLETRYSDTGHVMRYDGRDYATLELVRGGPDIIVFEGLAASEKSVEIWLPHNASLELRGLRLDDGASAKAADPPPLLGPLRQLDQPLPRSGPPDGHLAGSGRTEGRGRPDQPGFRRPDPARPGRRQNHPRPPGRLRQPEGGHQRGQRRHHERASFRPRPPGLSGYRPGRSPRDADVGDHADHLSTGRGPPGTDAHRPRWPAVRGRPSRGVVDGGTDPVTDPRVCSPWCSTGGNEPAIRTSTC